MTNAEAEVLDELIPLLARLHTAEHTPQPADGCVCCELIKHPRPVCLCQECAEEFDRALVLSLFGIEA